MKVIEEMYKCSYGLIEKNMCTNKDYVNAKLQVDKCYRQLCEELTGKEVDILDKLMFQRDVQAERKYAQIFKTGFETGLATALEALK